MLSHVLICVGGPFGVRSRTDRRCIIPDICHGRHGHVRVNFFWPGPLNSDLRLFWPFQLIFSSFIIFIKSSFKVWLMDG